MDSSDNSVIFDRPDMINGNKTTKVVNRVSDQTFDTLTTDKGESTG